MYNCYKPCKIEESMKKIYSFRKTAIGKFIKEQFSHFISVSMRVDQANVGKKDNWKEIQRKNGTKGV